MFKSYKKISFLRLFNRFITITFFLSGLFLYNTVSSYADVPVRRVVVFGLSNADSNNKALTTEMVESVRNAFNECGRFLPIPDTQVYSVFNEISEKSSDNVYLKTAEALKADLFVIVSAYQLGDTFYSSLVINPLNTNCSDLRTDTVLQSKIRRNLGIKAEKEVTIVHGNFPILADIQKESGENIFLINAGEWHGVKSGKSYETNQGKIRIIETGRFNSLVEMKNIINGNNLEIEIFPDTDRILKRLNNALSGSTVSEYSLDDLTGGNQKKRFIEGMCVMNTISNTCIPGYGSFLATGYFGFKDKHADVPGVLLSSALTVSHFVLPMFMSGFNINFFPWKQDNDKSDRVLNLQKFLWISLPATYSAAYLDQLSVQLENNKYLPPFFNEKNFTAGFLSLIIPGGGYFYKGRRLAGWSFYFSEMMSAGYIIYNYDSGKKSKYSILALSALKAIDIIGACFITPSYIFYNSEFTKDTESKSLNFKFETDSENNPEVKISVSQSF